MLFSPMQLKKVEDEQRMMNWKIIEVSRRGNRISATSTVIAVPSLGRSRKLSPIEQVQPTHVIQASLKFCCKSQKMQHMRRIS